MTRQEIEDYCKSVETKEVIFIDGFDEAIIGVSLYDNQFHVVYKVEKIIEILVQTMQMNLNDAWSYYDYNINIWSKNEACSPIFVDTKYAVISQIARESSKNNWRNIDEN